MDLTLNNSDQLFGYIDNSSQKMRLITNAVAVEVLRVGGGKIEGDAGSLDGFTKAARSALASRVLAGSNSAVAVISRMVAVDTDFSRIFVVDENGSLIPPTDAQFFSAVRRVWTEAATLPQPPVVPNV